MVDIYALDVDRVKAYLQAHQVFASLSAESLLRICEDTVLDSFEKNERLIKEGEESAFLYLIIEGTVDIRSYGVKIASCMKESLLGEVSASGLSVATAEVVATGKVSALSLPRSCIQVLATEEPLFADSLYDSAMSRILS